MRNVENNELKNSFAFGDKDLGSKDWEDREDKIKERLDKIRIEKGRDYEIEFYN